MEVLLAMTVAAAAVAAVLYPLILGESRGVPIEAEESANGRPADDAHEVESYRLALRARTLCRRCGRANPEDSLFCAECGHRLEAGRTRARAQRKQ